MVPLHQNFYCWTRHRTKYLPVFFKKSPQKWLHSSATSLLYSSLALKECVFSTFPLWPKSRGMLQETWGCWPDLTARGAQWEFSDKRQERKDRCYFWNDHDESCKEKLAAGLDRKVNQKVARKRKASLMSLQRSCRDIFKWCEYWEVRNWRMKDPSDG